MSEAHPKHIASLDGLRGIAIIVVLFNHGWTPAFPPGSALANFFGPLFSAGHIGVDLFFVLSGFLITGILLRAQQAENYFSVFYSRRALRIMPVYYVALALALLLIPAAEHFIPFMRAHAGPHATATEQILFWLNLSNLVTAFDPLHLQTISHFWSLAVEEQFYLLWPLVVRHVRARTVMIIGVASFFVVMAARNVPYILALNARYDNFIYRFTPFRVDSLLAGAALAALVHQRDLNRAWLPWLRSAFLIGFALFWAHVYFPAFFPARYFVFEYSVIIIVFSSLLAICLFPQTLTARFFRNRALRVIGKYSYFIYVFHLLFRRYISIPEAHFVGGNPDTVSFGYTAVSMSIKFLLLLGAAALSWKYFEGPINGYKDHFLYRLPKPPGENPPHGKNSPRLPQIPTESVHTGPTA